MGLYKKVPDEELAVLLQNNDINAFSEIYDRYKGVLYVHAFKRLNDSSEAEDLIQDLFTTLWNKRMELTINDRLSAYLYTAVRNRILKIIAHEKVKSDYIGSMKDFLEEGHFTTDHNLRSKDLARLIEEEISLLPEKMRRIFILSRYEHLSHKEIAIQLNISEQTVSKQITNALKILRNRLGLLTYLIFLIRF